MEKYFPISPFTGKSVQIGVSGSISAYKALDLLRALYKAEIITNVTLTSSACKFISPLSFRALGAQSVYTEMFLPSNSIEDSSYDPFGHLAPGTEADSFIIFPASATTLARLAHGLADEILSAQALAYPRPLLIAPAMNPKMWNNRATTDNCSIIRNRGHIILEPDNGVVACAEEGQGKLIDIRIAFLAILQQLSKQDLSGKKVMLTMGPTRELWDGVRYWSNHSTGFMGACFAISAMLRGAEVHAICGPGCPWLPAMIKRYNVTSASEMYTVAHELWPQADIGIFTAAVADFYPGAYGESKFKKSDAGKSFNIEFFPNKDILASLGHIKKSNQQIIGFAAETENLEEQVSLKLKKKNADILVGNLIGKANSGFASPLNTVFIKDNQGKEEAWPVMPKTDVAWRVLDWLLRL